MDSGRCDASFKIMRGEGHFFDFFFLGLVSFFINFDRVAQLARAICYHEYASDNSASIPQGEHCDQQRHGCLLLLGSLVGQASEQRHVGRRWRVIGYLCRNASFYML